MILIEKVAKHLDFTYVVTFRTGLGVRSGYVAVPASYEVQDEKIKVHNGIDYIGGGDFPIITKAKSTTWYGFDCGSENDKVDLKKLNELIESETINEETKKQIRTLIDFEVDYKLSSSSNTVKSHDFVEKECKSVIEQIKEQQ